VQVGKQRFDAATNGEVRGYLTFLWFRLTIRTLGLTGGQTVDVRRPVTRLVRSAITRTTTSMPRHHLSAESPAVAAVPRVGARPPRRAVDHMHGDLQIVHVFVDGDEITGVLDWSEAGETLGVADVSLPPASLFASGPSHS